jgi:hypothetical protein
MQYLRRSMHSKRKLSRFNNGPTPNRPMVMNDFYYNKTHLKTTEVISFPRNTLNNTNFYLAKNTLKLAYSTRNSKIFQGRTPKGLRFNEGNGEGLGDRMGRGRGKRRGEGEERRNRMRGRKGGRGHGRRKGRERKGGKVVGGRLRPQGWGIDAPGRCHSKYVHNFWDRINPIADQLSGITCQQHSESRRLAFTG